MIKLLCKNRQIIRTDNQWIVERTRNVDPLSVSFDEEWNDLIISITFRNGEIGPYSMDFVEGMNIPSQFLETGEIYISFEGRKTIDPNDMVILRTGEMQYPLLCHRSGDGVSIPPPDLPPDIWELAIAKSNEALNIAKSVREDADAGKFNGEQGIPGEGVPNGGRAGQALAKKSDSDYDTEWVDINSFGVNSWNGRKGDIIPQDGDYTYTQIKGLQEQLEKAKKGDTFIYKQKAPSTLWTINHNLDKYPDVTIVDSANTVVVGEIIYIDKNSLNIAFSSGFSGTAYLN